MRNSTEKINLTQKAAKGASWGLISNVSVSAISFIGTAILARLLDPKRFWVNWDGSFDNRYS